MYLYTCIYVFVHKCIYISMYLCIYVYIYVCICIHVCMYLCIYVYIYFVSCVFPSIQSLHYPSTMHPFFFSSHNFLLLAQYFQVPQSAWAVEYTDSISAKGTIPPTSFPDMTLNNLMVRFQECWSFGKCGEPFHCHHSLVHFGPEV